MGVFRQCLNMLVPKGRKQRHPDLLAIVIVLLIPIGYSVLSFVRKMQVGNADIIVSGVGVLGGLLFAHAIFVFQLRMAYSDAKHRRASEASSPLMEKTAVIEMIDQMFYSVVYASALSLIITLVIGLASSLRLCDKKGIFPVWFSALVIFLIAHLAGWVWYVISITASAYRDLIKEL